MRKLRRLSKSTISVVKRSPQISNSSIDERRVQIARIAHGDATHILQLGRKLISGRQRMFAAILPGINYGRQNLVEPWHPAGLVRRPIRTAIERLQLGSQE